MEKVEAKRLSGAETDLEKAVQRICNDYAEDYYDGVVGFLKDLQYGCASGIVAELVYYSDTVKFYKKHQDEIEETLAEMLENTGLSINELFQEWEASDPLGNGEVNQNYLAWFAFEETARKLADNNGIEP